MHATTSVGLALAGHRYLTEHALETLRHDCTLDDREKSRRISRVIEAANARAIELLRQNERRGLEVRRAV
jgi:hypothetical protein